MRGPIQRTPPRRGSPEGARPGHQTTEADAKRSDGRHRRHANSRQTPAPNEQLAEAGAKRTAGRHRRQTNSWQRPAPNEQLADTGAKRTAGRGRRQTNSWQTPAPNEQLAEAGAKSRQSPFVGNYEEASTTGNPNSGRSPCFVTAVKFTTVTKQDISGVRYRNRKEEPAGRCIHIHNH